MDISAFIYSLIGGTTVAALNHFLGQRHQLLMKRELYREILYREKVRAYSEVYALGAALINEIEKFDALEDADSNPMPAVKALVVFIETIKKHSLFMPGEVISKLEWCEEITEHMIETPAIAQGRYELDVEPTKDQICLLAGKEECLAVLDILKQDLGVEILTKDLGEFFRSASLQVEKKPFWKTIFEKKPRPQKADKKPEDTN